MRIGTMVPVLAMLTLGPVIAPPAAAHARSWTVHEVSYQNADGWDESLARMDIYVPEEPSEGLHPLFCSAGHCKTQTRGRVSLPDQSWQRVSERNVGIHALPGRQMLWL